MEGLRGHISGLAVPTYVVDAPHGGGKLPIMPNYLISASDDAIVLRTYDGMIVHYKPEDKKPTGRPARINRGVSAVLEGTKPLLVPEGNEHMARRKLRKKSRGKTEKNGDGCCSEETPKPRSAAKQAPSKTYRESSRPFVTSLPVVVER